MNALAEAGLTRVLVEGGGQVAASLIRADVVDRIAWFHAPGGDGRRWLGGGAGFRDRKTCYDASLVRHRVTPLGGDMLSEFKRPT